jgi:hypothetical protein
MQLLRNTKRIVTIRIRVESSPRRRFETPADFPLQDCSPYRGLHARHEHLGVVPRSRAIFCRPFTRPHASINAPLGTSKGRSSSCTYVPHLRQQLGADALGVRLEFTDAQRRPDLFSGFLVGNLGHRRGLFLTLLTLLRLLFYPARVVAVQTCQTPRAGSSSPHSMPSKHQMALHRRPQNVCGSTPRCPCPPWGALHVKLLHPNRVRRNTRRASVLRVTTHAAGRDCLSYHGRGPVPLRYAPLRRQQSAHFAISPHPGPGSRRTSGRTR